MFYSRMYIICISFFTVSYSYSKPVVISITWMLRKYMNLLVSILTFVLPIIVVNLQQNHDAFLIKALTFC